MSVPTIEFLTIEFREDEIHDGDVPREHVGTTTREYDRYDADEYGSPAEWAAYWLRHEGTTEDAGNWFADPDGSYIVDYAQGIRHEKSAHLEGFSDEDMATLRRTL